jgi:hypothetical protein
MFNCLFFAFILMRRGQLLNYSELAAKTENDLYAT